MIFFDKHNGWCVGCPSCEDGIAYSSGESFMNDAKTCDDCGGCGYTLATFADFEDRPLGLPYNVSATIWGGSFYDMGDNFISQASIWDIVRVYADDGETVIAEREAA